MVDLRVGHFHRCVSLACHRGMTWICKMAHGFSLVWVPLKIESKAKVYVH